MHFVDLGESFQTHIFLQILASIQPRTSPGKFAVQHGGRSQVKIRDGAVDMLDRVEEGEDDEEMKETEQRAIEFRRIQVQRKAEDFLRHYTKGQNLVKVLTLTQWYKEEFGAVQKRAG